LIAAQLGVITNAEKKMKQLQTDSVELQKKIVKLQEEMLINSKAQEAQVAEIVNQKKILEAIQTRKKVLMCLVEPWVFCKCRIRQSS